MLINGAFRRLATLSLSLLLVLSAAGQCLAEGTGGTVISKPVSQAQPQLYPLLTTSKLNRIIQTEGKGKVVIISFFASWCPPCRKEIPQLVHLRGKVSKDDMLIIGISADDNLLELNKFLDRVKINFPVYLGMDDVFMKYEVTAIPVMVLLNSDGTVYQVVEGLLNESTFNGMINHLLGKAYE